MTNFTTISLTDNRIHRDLFRMHGTRFMEVLHQPATSTSPETNMMRVVDMGEPGGTPTVVSRTQIMGNLPFNLKDFVMGHPGATITGNWGTTTNTSYDSRGKYGVSLPFSPNELLITHGNKMYRFVYDEVADLITFEGEVGKGGNGSNLFPNMYRYSYATSDSSMMVQSAMIRMGDSDSFLVIQHPKLFENYGTTQVSGSFDTCIVQVYEYRPATDMVMASIVCKATIIQSDDQMPIIKSIPGSNKMYVSTVNISQDPMSDDLTYRGSNVYTNNDKIVDTDGTYTNLSNCPNGYMPLPLTDTSIWWVGRSDAKFIDYADSNNNKEISYTSGQVGYKNNTRGSTPNGNSNDGIAINDTEFLLARNYRNGEIQVMAVKDTGFGFGETSPHGVITLGQNLFPDIGTSNTSDHIEDEATHFLTPQGDGEYGNALYMIDDYTIQYECLVHIQTTPTQDQNEAMLFMYRMNRPS